MAPPINAEVKSATKDKLLTVNFHLEKTCNYKCKFCYVIEGFDRGDNE